jgi:hypothetical protein
MSIGDFNVAGGIDAPGAYTLVYEKIFDSAVTTHDMPANSLDGDADGAYMIEMFLVNGYNGTTGMTVRYNGTGNIVQAQTQYHVQNGGTSSTIRNTADIAISCTAYSNVDTAHSFIHLPNVATGYPRAAFNKDIRKPSTTTILVVDWHGGILTPAQGTNITSLGCGCTQTSGIGIGSFFRVYKLK